jgi:glycosyltransferase involved in cell wall biosynthesis
MQGLKGQIAKVFCGGLTLREQLRCVGIKEVLKRRTMHSDRRDFARWAPFEEEIIRGHQFVDVQTDWVAAQVKAVHPAAHLFKVDLALRQPFHDADGWRGANQPVVFCSAAYSSPFKGLHVAIRALGLLRQRIPAARLRIAGGLQQVGIRQNGYMRWVNRLVRQLKLGSAVEWLGPLNAEQIVAELKRAAAVVFPTFIENCCTGMQEALAVGAPVAASYAGGIPSLGRDEDSCIFFPPGDEAMCAHQLERLLTDHDLAARLSRRAREIASQRHDRESLVRWQLDIYRKVIAQWTSGRRSSAVAASAAASLTPC